MCLFMFYCWLGTVDALPKKKKKTKKNQKEKVVKKFYGIKYQDWDVIIAQNTSTE